jgi:hypothetical protein
MATQVQSTAIGVRRVSTRRLAIWVGYWLATPLVAFELVGRLLFPFYADGRTFFPQLAAKVMMSTVVLKEDHSNRRYSFRTAPYETIAADNQYFKYTARTNSLGFRGTVPTARQPGEYRIMLVGDSATFGLGLNEPDTIAEQLKLIGRERCPASAKVTAYNFGHLGFNLVQELLILRDYFDTVKPEQVVLILSVYTDNLSNAVSGLDDEGNFRYSKDAVAKLAADIKDYHGLLNLSLLFRMFEYKYLATRTYYSLSVRPDVPVKSFAILDSFDEFCRSQGAHFTVANVYSPDAVEGGLHAWWNGSRKVHAMFTEYCLKNNIDVIDMIRYMNGYANRKKYFYGEGHPNPAGARKIAEVIFDDSVAGRLPGK